MVRQNYDIGNDGTQVRYNQTEISAHTFVLGRIDGPRWECGSGLTIIAEIECNLDNNTILHIQEDGKVNCWG